MVIESLFLGLDRLHCLRKEDTSRPGADIPDAVCVACDDRSVSMSTVTPIICDQEKPQRETFCRRGSDQKIHQQHVPSSMHFTVVSAASA